MKNKPSFDGEGGQKMLIFETKNAVIKLNDCDLASSGDLICDNGDFFDVSLTDAGMQKVYESHLFGGIENAWLCIKPDGVCYLFVENEQGVLFYKSTNKYIPESIKKVLDKYDM